MSEITWLEQAVESGEVRFRVGRAASGALVVEWPGDARLFQDGDGWRFETEPHLSSERAAKLARGPARAVQRYLAGEMSLHASAIEIGGRALVFLGAGGAGKSTIAAKLCDQCGATLLADDVLAVDRTNDGLFALPTESAHWLEVPGQESKRARAAQRIAAIPTVVAELVLLDVNESPADAQPTLVKGRAAMLALSQAHITLPIATPEQRRRDFEWLAKVCESVKMTRIARRCAGSPDDVVSEALRLLEKT